MQTDSESEFAQWDEERYSTQIERFDEQHRRLFGLLNDLHTAMQEGHSNEEVGDILRELERYTEYHFGDEEEFMQDCGYAMDCADCFYNHREMHEEFAQKVRSLREKHENGEYVTMEVLSFVREWLDAHIADGDEDQNYSAYFAEEVSDDYEYTPGALYRDRTGASDQEPGTDGQPGASSEPDVTVASDTVEGADLSVHGGSVADWLDSLAASRGDRTAVIRTGEGRDQRSFAAFYERAREVAGGLLATDLRPGDRVAIAADPRYEWSVVDAACHLAGLVSVPLYTSFGDGQTRSVIDRTAVSGLVAPDPSSATGADTVGTLVDIADLPTADSRALPGFEVGGDDLATVVFDATEAPEPTGIRLTHENLLAATASLADGLSLEEGTVGTCFLPLAHVYQRVATYALWAAGGAVGYVDPDSLIDDLRELRPDVLVGVPKVYQRLYGDLQDRIGSLGWMKRSVAGRVTAYGRDIVSGKGTPFKYAAAERLVYGPLREEFGLSEVSCALVGTGRLDEHLLQFFRGLGVPVTELYGPIEAGGVGALNRAASYRADAVGEPMAGTEFALAADGTVLVRGRCVTPGYLSGGSSDERVHPDGWIRTAETGTFGADGTLSLTE